MLTQNKITNNSQQGGNDNHPTNNTNKQNNSSKISLYNNNNTPLGRTIKTININPEQLDKLHSSFNNIVDAQIITNKIELYKKQMIGFEKVQELSNDFINLLKLKIILKRE